MSSTPHLIEFIEEEIAEFVNFTAWEVRNGSVLQVRLWSKANKIAEYANASAVDRLAWLADLA